MPTEPSTSDLQVPYEAVKAVAAELFRQYDSEFRAQHLSWQDFVGAAREVLNVAGPILIAAGRAQAAAGIRAAADDEAARPTRDANSHLIEKWLREAARIAQEGPETT